MIARLFPLWAILFSIFAYFMPAPLAALSDWIVPLLMVINMYTNRP
ncbi:hypothetical protein [Alloalcanivorax xenomutans]|nr:hypothetical protein [Alloalcanivorax xenomutans]WOA30695.1 hypothetical protein RVY87_17665 [Alloalcanivorax xenomutans]